jgi:hypothetical protein
MLKLLSCSNGHFWEATETEDGLGPQNVFCPVCGALSETLPVLDLAPSETVTLPQAEPPPPLPLRDDKGRPVVAGYDLLDDLGRGPTGIASYRAKQVLVNRVVLLRVVTARDDPGQVAWGGLRGEAAALAKARHPNIVPIHEAGERERQLFYNALELAEGPTLSQAIAGKPLAPAEAAGLIEALARAVQVAHDAGVVHRSIKPSSIVLQPAPDADGAAPPYCRFRGKPILPRLIDFGLARRPAEGEATDVELQVPVPSWLSPEQAWGRAREIGPLSDVYALGAVLYECLTGAPPYKGGTPGMTVEQIQRGRLVPPCERALGVPSGLDAICRKAMQPVPGRRYASAKELADDLQRWRTGRALDAAPPGLLRRMGQWGRRQPALAALLAILVLTAVGWGAAFFFSRRETEAERARADRKTRDEKKARSEAEQLAAELEGARARQESLIYAHRFARAELARGGSDARPVHALLDSFPPNRREWEWYFLKAQLAGSKPQRLTGLTLPVLALAFSPDGARLAAAGGVDGRQGNPPPRGEGCVWAVPAGNVLFSLDVLPHPLRGLAFSPNGERLLGAGGAITLARNNDGELRSWHGRTGALQFTRAFNDAQLTGLALAPDGATAALADSAGRLRLAQTADGLPAGLVTNVGSEGLGATAVQVVSAGQGRWAASNNGTGQVVRLFTNLREQPAQLLGHTGLVRALAYDPGSGLLASGGADRTVRLWDVASRGQTHVLEGHRNVVTALAFTRNGKRLASGAADGSIKIWSPADGLELLTLSPPTSHGGGITALAFGPDGKRLAVAVGEEVYLYTLQ